MKKFKKFNKTPVGYRLTVVSWENDGDNYNTTVQSGLTKEQTAFYVDLINVIGGDFGNMYDPDEEEINNLKLALEPIVVKHADYCNAEFKEDMSEDDFVLNMSSDLHYEFFGGSEYYTRNLESFKVEYIPVEINIEDVTHDFQ